MNNKSEAKNLLFANLKGWKGRLIWRSASFIQHIVTCTYEDYRPQPIILNEIF